MFTVIGFGIISVKVGAEALGKNKVSQQEQWSEKEYSISMNSGHYKHLKG